jgi:hypothetical protein
MSMAKLDKNSLKGRALFLGERLDLRALKPPTDWPLRHLQ